MDLLKDYIDEEELLKVSGGWADRKSFSKMITSLALAGTLCVPAQAISLEQTSKLTNADYSQKLSKEKFIKIPKAPKTPHICRLGIDNAGKYHYICSQGLPPKEQFGVMTGVLSCGVLVSAGVGWTLEAHSDWRKMDDHFENIIKNTDKCTQEDLTKYSRWELQTYIQKNVTSWVDVMEDRLKQEVHGQIEVSVPYYKNTDVWNKNLNLLFKSVLASLCLDVKTCRNPEASAASRLEDLKAYKKTSNEKGKTTYIMTQSNSTISYPTNECEPLTKYHGLPNLDWRNILPVFNYVLANVCNAELLCRSPRVCDFVNKKEVKWASEILNRVTRGLSILPFEWMPK